MGSLLSASEIATILGIDSSSINTTVVDWKEKEVEKLLNKAYTAVADATQEFFLTDVQQDYLALDTFPITSVSKIEYYDETTEAWIELDAPYYHTELDSGMIFFDFEIYRRLPYKVTFNYGGDTPTDLEKELHFLLVFKHLTKHNASLFSAPSTGGVESEKIGEYAVKYNVEKMKSQPALIDEEIESLLGLLGGGSGFNDAYLM